MLARNAVRMVVVGLIVVILAMSGYFYMRVVNERIFYRLLGSLEQRVGKVSIFTNGENQYALLLERVK